MCFVGVMSRFNNSFRKYEKVLSFGGKKDARGGFSLVTPINISCA